MFQFLNTSPFANPSSGVAYLLVKRKGSGSSPGKGENVSV